MPTNTPEIDFDTINDELMQETIEPLNVPQAETMIVKTIDLTPFIEAAEGFEIVDRESAKQCLSMSLQARKMRQALDKTRSEIIRPALDFQKAINKFAKTFETKLQEIEDGLSTKLREYMKNSPETNNIDLMNQSIKVEDGTISKKMKWVFEIENADEVPRDFLCVDEKKIQLAIKNGIRHIKGVKIYESMEIDMRVKNLTDKKNENLLT